MKCVKTFDPHEVARNLDDAIDIMKRAWMDDKSAKVIEAAMDRVAKYRGTKA